MNMLKKKSKGFTLIELLTVISIITVLSSVAVVGVNSYRTKSRDAKRTADLKKIEEALYVYFNEYGHYPIGKAEIELAGACGDDPYLIIQNNPLIIEDIGPVGDPIDGIKDTSASNPWIVQLGPYGYPDCSSAGKGYFNTFWIKDPLNSGIYIYVYAVKKDLSSFELSVPLENNSALMQNDGGNRNDRYELGPGKNTIYSS